MKTATELGITKAELANLIKVRDLLASNAIEKGTRFSEDKSDAFNMGYSCSSKDVACGSIMCIGGWMRTFELGLKPNGYGVYAISGSHADDITAYVDNAQGKPIGSLFWPMDEYGDVRLDLTSITPAEAVVAIDNFLRTGNPDWDNAAPRPADRS